MLINFVYEDISSLKKYSDMIIAEFKRRDYNIREQSFCKYREYFEGKELVEVEEVFPKKMNDRYFRQCYYNLEEKYDYCGSSGYGSIRGYGGERSFPYSGHEYF